MLGEFSSPSSREKVLSFFASYPRVEAFGVKWDPIVFFGPFIPTGPDAAPTLTIVPPQASPRNLTAQHRPATLHDHFLAFLNTHNRSGFEVPRPEREKLASIIGDLHEETIHDLMLLVSTADSLSEHDIKNAAANIRKMTMRAIRHSMALDLISALLGYSNWHEVRGELNASAHGRVINHRYRLAGTAILDVAASQHPDTSQ